MIILKEDLEGFSLELARATVYVLINGLEGLEIVVDHLLRSAIVHQNLAAENHQTILGCLRIVLQLTQS